MKVQRSKKLKSLLRRNQDAHALAPASPRGLSAIGKGLVEVSPIVAVSKPVFGLDDAVSPFHVRFGTGVVYHVQKAEYSVSPSGALRAFLKLLARWLIALAALFCTVGVLGLIASTFIESISRLLMLAAQHLFWLVVYIGGTLAIGSLVFALVVWLVNRRKE
jgi:Na+/serine symporter